jgi:hypothetical protein
VRRHVLRGAGAAVCLVVATLLVLLALDARAWSGRITADDLRYARDPTAHRLWQPRQLAPFGMARKVLGLDDDLAYRRALRAFRISRPLDPLYTTDVTTRRIQAQLALTDLLSKHGNAVQRTQAANLLGVLGFSLSMSAQDTSSQSVSTDTAVGAFRRAIGFDPQNDDALSNLEYALDQSKGNDDQGGPKDRSGRGSGAGLKRAGHGY